MFLLLAGALGYGVWSWRQLTRPGRVHLDRGMDDAAAGKYGAAEQEWQTGVRLDPTFPGCYERLGDLCQSVSQYPQAIADYAAAAQLSPNDGLLFSKLATAQKDNDDDGAAFASAKKAYQLLPNDAAVVELYGNLAGKRDQPAEAILALQKAHRLMPSNPRYVVELASVEMDSGDTVDAENVLRGYLAVRPNDGFACYLMAAIYNQKPRTPSNLNAAMTYAERSYSSGSAPPNVYSLLAQLYLAAGRVQDARNACLAGLRMNPKDTAVMATLVSCYQRLNQPQQAAQLSAYYHATILLQDRIEHLREAMGFTPHDVPSGLELARLEEEDGGAKYAEPYYLAVLRLNPHNPHARAALVGDLERMGRPDQAKQVMNPAFVP